ncbi:hypothetical protein Tco_1293307 [Tanacetum coccineum]
MQTERRDGVADFKRWRQDFQSDGVMDLVTASGRSRLKVALQDSTLSFLCAPVRELSLTLPFFTMENANLPSTNNPPVLPTALRAKIVQELNELQAISTYIDSHLENIDQLLNGFTQQPNEINVDDLESDDESVDTPLVSPFLDSDDDSDDGEVLNELEEYDNTRKLCRQRAINSFDGDDLAFQNFSRKNEEEIFTDAGDGVRIDLDGVIFDEKKLGSS